MKKQISFFTTAVVLFSLAVTPVFAAELQPGFDPNKIIDDVVFSDLTFGSPEGIQKFLESKNSVLANTSSDFLLKLKEPSTTSIKQGLEDPQPNLPRLRTAAELIWDASKQSVLTHRFYSLPFRRSKDL
jgi:hypothetical protein